MQRHKRVGLLLLLAATLAAQALSNDPLVGTWTLASQTVNGQKVDSDDLTLRIYPKDNALEFAYSTPVNGIHLVSLRFTSVRLDGAPGVVEDGKGNKMGTVTVKKLDRLDYKAVIEGPNRPKAVGKMMVSADGKTLTSQSGASEDSKGGSQVVQVFTRR